MASLRHYWRRDFGGKTGIVYPLLYQRSKLAACGANSTNPTLPCVPLLTVVFHLLPSLIYTPGDPGRHLSLQPLFEIHSRFQSEVTQTIKQAHRYHWKGFFLNLLIVFAGAYYWGCGSFSYSKTIYSVPTMCQVLYEPYSHYLWALCKEPHLGGYRKDIIHCQVSSQCPWDAPRSFVLFLSNYVLRLPFLLSCCFYRHEGPVLLFPQFLEIFMPPAIIIS